MSGDAKHLLSLLPPIRRARGFRLYTADGRRILDLWQSGGRAILGHRGGSIVTRVKQDLDRGLLFPSFDPVRYRRLVRALETLIRRAFPAAVTVYPSWHDAYVAIRAAGGPESISDPGVGPALTDDPAVTSPDSAAMLWRPYLWSEDAVLSARWILPVLPDGGLSRAQVVLDRQRSDADPEAEPVATATIGSLATAAYALLRAPERDALELPGFTECGPYVTYVGESGYETVFRRFLDAGILLSPDPNAPSIIPGDMSDGERALLMRIAKES